MSKNYNKHLKFNPKSNLLKIINNLFYFILFVWDMREDLLYYGNVDGLAPQGRCSLHRHPNDVVVDHRFNSGSVRWMPYAEEKLKVAYESKENAPRVALLGAECLEHPLLPNASFHSFLSNNLASPYIMPKKQQEQLFLILVLLRIFKVIVVLLLIVQD